MEVEEHKYKESASKDTENNSGIINFSDGESWKFEYDVITHQLSLKRSSDLKEIITFTEQQLTDWFNIKNKMVFEKLTMKMFFMLLKRLIKI